PHPWAFHHDAVGYNDRMPNINAAVGVAQLEQLPRFLIAKRAVQARYEHAFSDFAGARLFRAAPWAESNGWLVALILERADPQRADPARPDRLRAASHGAGLRTRPAWALMHRLPMYRDHPRADLSTAESLEARIICLPSSASLGFAHV